MSTETYKIVRSGKSWAVNDDGRLEGDYAAKEAAFEAAAVAGSNCIKDGVGVTIAVAPREPGETVTGGKH